MRLFTYYALHAFKNQLRKLFKTWVLLFLIVCVALGAVMGLFAAFLTDHDEPSPEDQTQTEVLEEGPAFLETAGVEQDDLIELIAGGIILALFTFYALSADKNGSRIFLPADVNLLFASPMKPQSVLMFRLATQLGVAVLASVYMFFQLPNLTLNLGLGIWAALALIGAWCLTIVYGALIQILLYTLSATYPGVKRALRPAVYGLLGLIAAGYLLFTVRSGQGWLQAAAAFFNAGFTRETVSKVLQKCCKYGSLAGFVI